MLECQSFLSHSLGQQERERVAAQSTCVAATYSLSFSFFLLRFSSYSASSLMEYFKTGNRGHYRHLPAGAGPWGPAVFLFSLLLLYVCVCVW